jgi:hypothetical protein
VASTTKPTTKPSVPSSSAARTTPAAPTPKGHDKRHGGDQGGN